jgi:hypothetical protein
MTYLIQIYRSNGKAGFAAIVAVAACCILVALTAGCGAKRSYRSDLPPREQVVENLLFGIVEEEPTAVLSALPPAWLGEVRNDMRLATDEEIATVIVDSLRFAFPYTEILAVQYRVEQRGDGTCDVFYWGEFRGTGASGKKRTVKVNEAEAKSFNLIEIDGSYYLNI